MSRYRHNNLEPFVTILHIFVKFTHIRKTENRPLSYPSPLLHSAGLCYDVSVVHLRREGCIDVEFVEITKAEYKRTYIKTSLLTPLTETVESIWQPFVILCVLYILYILESLVRLNNVLIILGVMCIISIGLRTALMIGRIIYLLHTYAKSHKAFCSQVTGLSRNTYEMLQLEYQTSSKIQIIYQARKKKRQGAETVYITENFLIIPGYFLVNSEEISDIHLIEPLLNNKTTFKFILKDQTVRELNLYRRYRVSDETADQIMVWSRRWLKQG